jgi:hypothetical protein
MYYALGLCRISLPLQAAYPSASGGGCRENKHFQKASSELRDPTFQGTLCLHWEILSTRFFLSEGSSKPTHSSSARVQQKFWHTRGRLFDRARFPQFSVVSFRVERNFRCSLSHRERGATLTTSTSNTGMFFIVRVFSPASLAAALGQGAVYTTSFLFRGRC